MGEEFLHLSNEPWVLRMCVRLLLAALLGALVGLEREHHGRTAGLRTQLLVALGSALVVVVSVTFTEVFAPAAAAGALRIDPSRAAYGVITGIGFLGAGVIAPVWLYDPRGDDGGEPVVHGRHRNGLRAGHVRHRGVHDGGGGNGPAVPGQDRQQDPQPFDANDHDSMPYFPAKQL